MAGDRVQQRDAEPIAVIGMSCRLPQAGDPEAFWSLLRDGVDAITDASEDRWPSDVLPDHRRGGFVSEVDTFDAAFFGISPNEAALMDPQQRLAMELAWEALEHTRIVPADLRGTQAGVFVGAIGHDYAALQDRYDVAGAQAYTGGHRAMIANRVSYFLGLKGPSLTLDAGQSSSLIAVQFACESLRRGETAIALAGGVNLNLLAETTAAIGRFGALSPQGRCHVFDSRADGYVRGEGGALVVLKPLSAALRDGDTVHCVVLGGAVNNDGGGDGLTAPNQAAQREVIQTACRQAGVRPSDVQYVELHGTGTKVGDPVEASALGTTLGAGRPEEEPLLVGSVKTNIGHLEGAAGIAGLLKVVLSIAHGKVPASLNFETPNPDIALDELRLNVVAATRDWPRPESPLAGVSSFGMGGTNCHLVLGAPPEKQKTVAAQADLPWLLSARSAQALRAQAQRLHEALTPDTGAGEVALALLRTRAEFEHRAVLLGDDPAAALAALAEGRPDNDVVTGTVARGLSCFTFPGQGSQWPEMARDLLDSAPEFAASIAECADALAPFVDYSLLDVLRGVKGAPDFDRVDVVQPALWAVMVSLAALWRANGVAPDVVVGHSQGEIAAATAIGALSISDGARVVALRSKAITRIAGSGGMMSVAAPLDVVTETLELHPGAGVAAVNGPRSTVVSGPQDVLAALQQEFENAGHRAKIVPVDYASHSAAVAEIRAELAVALAPVAPVSVGTLFVSTLTGESMDTAGLDADYWYDSLRNPVLFADATRRAFEHGCALFVECSPHPVLVGAVEETAEQAEHGAVAVGTLRRTHGDANRFRRALAEAYAGGAPVCWSTEDAPRSALLALPTYAFQRRRHWLAVPDSAAAPRRAISAAEPEQVAELASLSRKELRELVLATTATVLGHPDAGAVTPNWTFKELGVDSATAVELRNRLRAATGLTLPTGLLFDHPTPDQVIAHLHELAGGGQSEIVAGPRAEADDDPVVVVAMGCRYPGEIASPDDLWGLVSAGGEAITEFPVNRGWDTDALFADGPDRSGTSDTRLGGFLHDADQFDAAFFGISPREATAMDPQQRLLLEICWETVERAGLDVESLRGTRTGVFVGAMAPDYGPRLHQPSGGADGHLLTGTALSVVSGRIAYTLGLTGPAMTVDTACSSSLVAVHLAAQALRRGECTLALAGGATVMSSPGMFVEFSRQGGLSVDGRCKAFSADADGTGWGEGAGMVLLERLSDARAQGHPVLAVLRGSAVNQDGRSNGMTAPSGTAQQRVISDALADAGLTAAEVDVVEAHGTGTRLGDPIEATALQAVYGREHDADRPLWLGSIKTNIGHTQAAAGVAGVIKMVKALEHRVLPRTLHVGEPTPHVDWSDGAVRLLTDQVELPADRPSRAAVSSFGISGTNAHVILERAPEPETAAAQADGPLVWAFSARTADALRAMAVRLLDFAVTASDDDLAASGAVLAGRASLAQRAVVVAADREELLAALGALAAGDEHPALVQGVAGSDVRPVFVFPGQGSQWVGMAVELLDSDSVFAEQMSLCDVALRPFTGWSVVGVLRGAVDAPELAGTEVIQPALWAVMVSLATRWCVAGVRPAAVIGHSQGEIAAAYVAGALSLEDSARIVALRSKSLLQLSGSGGMVAVALSAEDVAGRIAAWAGRLWLAVHSGPTSCVLAGDPVAIEEFVAECGESVQVRRIGVDYASHTPHIDVLREEILSVLAGVTPKATEIEFCSSLAGGFLDTAELSTDYWYDSLRNPVRFEQGIRALSGGSGTPLFIETSPHPALTGHVQDTLRSAECAGFAIGSLRRGDGGSRRFLLSAAAAYVHGVALDWRSLLGAPGRTVELPSYPFQGKRFWHDSAAGTGSVTAGGMTASQHPLLSATVAQADNGGFLLTGRLSRGLLPWLGEHVIDGKVLVPGTAFVELVLEAGAVAGCDRIEDLTLEAPIVLSDRGATQTQVVVGGENEDGRRPVALYTRADDDEPWTRHATGTLGADAAGETAALAWPPQGGAIDLADVYERLDDRGYQYGPTFQGLAGAWRDGDERYVDVVLPEPFRADAGSFTVHPALLDAALHLLVLDGTEPVDGETTQLLLPFSWRGVQVAGHGAEALRVRITALGEDAVALAVHDATGQWIAGVEELVLRRVAKGSGGGDAGRTAPAYSVTWTEPSDVDDADLAGRALAVVGYDSAADDLVAELAATGADVTLHYSLSSVAETSGDAMPDTVLALYRPDVDADDLPYSVREAMYEALDLVQSWIADERMDGRTLVFVTRGAHDPDEEGMAAAALWGLLRSAMAEHPGRFAVVDTGECTAWPSVAGALAADEPQIMVRDDTVLVPRLVRQDVPEPAGLTLDGTVLVTGGTGALGSLTARHLVQNHGARHLLLTSRSGQDAPGATELVTELAELGASVTVAACDVSDRRALIALLDTIPDEQPLCGVVHTAGVLDDATVESLSGPQFDTVFEPKADAAWYLHELTAGLPLSLFVLFSSVAGVLGNAGQGNYAAANAFLDGLAAHRRRAELPAVSVAFGVWDAGLAGGMTAADVARLARSGIAPLTPELGLDLLDRAIAAPESLTVAAKWDNSGLRANAQNASFPAVLRGLVRVRRTVQVAAAAPGAAPALGSPAAGSTELVGKLATLSEGGARTMLIELVRSHVATVLGHSGVDGVEVDRAFTELGFDSLTAVELRNRLDAATGLRLPAALAFDYPTVAVLAEYLRTELAPTVSVEDMLSETLDRIQAVLPERDDATRGKLVASLRNTITRLDTGSASSSDADEDDPVVVVAMGCRYPGEIASPDDLWGLVSAGGEAITEFPVNRGWDTDALFADGPDRSGTSDTRVGGFLHDADQFDAAFFGISPREAIAMDPQQRLLLEVCWETVERAGVDVQSLRGSKTGVFVGAMASDYGPRWHLPTGSADGHLLTGTSLSVASGRIAYLLGLTGPAMTVDTACSSSLVALHLAAQALRRGECSMALAGGVTVMSTPGIFVEFSRQGGLAVDGSCKAFSSDADGTGWSEGVGMVLLERMSVARAQGHPVLAVLRGSAVNQDGRSNGMTAPSGPSQQRVIADALADAGLRAAEVDVVEAHGTGTRLGDPIEATALQAVYGRDRDADRPLWLGSIKTNLGHTQAAAGVAGVIKMVKALEHRVLPRTLHVGEPTRHVDWSAGTIRLLTDEVELPADRPARAAVSSFGISGTNAHVILERAPEPETAAAQADGPLVWAFSARTGEALRAMATRLRDFAVIAPDGDLAAAPAVLAGRAALEHRAVVVATDRAELLAGLAAVVSGEPHPAVVRGVAGSDVRPVFVFPGQGTQWTGMAVELLDSNEVFAAKLAECDAELAEYTGWSVRDVLRGANGAPALEASEVIQPALFAVMVSLAAVWRSVGIEPTAVIGHSQGEVTAACVAGALSIADCARVIALRSKLLMTLAETGGMLALAVSAARAEELIAPYPGRLWVAIMSGPESTVVAGDVDAIDELVEDLGDTVRAKRIAVDYAAHTEHVEEVRDEFSAIVADIEHKATEVVFCSALTGDILDTAELTGDYWYEGLRNPVRFEQGIRALSGSGTPLFIETSPHPALTGHVQDTLRSAECAGFAIGSLRRGEGGSHRFLLSAAAAYVHGATLDWRALLGEPVRHVELPSYPFQGTRFWLDGSGSAAATASGLAASSHPLLGAVVALANGDGLLLTGRLSRGVLPWLGDHVVDGEILLPGTAFVELVLEAGAVAGCDRIEDLTLESPIVLPDSGAVQLQIVVGGPDEHGRCAVSLYARGGDEHDWVRHAVGTLGVAVTPEVGELVWPPAGAEADLTDAYPRLADQGYQYGPAFQGLERAWHGDGARYVDVVLPEPLRGDAGRFTLHPALLDAALHLLVLDEIDDGDAMLLPFSWRGVQVAGHGAEALRMRITELDAERVSLSVYDAQGNWIGAVDELTLRRAARQRRTAGRSPSAYTLNWTALSGLDGADAVDGVALTGQRLAVIGDDRAAEDLTTELAELGADVSRFDDLLSLAALGAEQLPAAVLAPFVPGHDTDHLPQSVHEGMYRALGQVQGWIADERFAGRRLLFVTHGAQHTGEDLTAAPLWGLVRSAQTEHPDRFGLVDTDERPLWTHVAGALAAGESQIMMRDGELLVPRLVEQQQQPVGEPLALDGTVLVTGGTGALGALVARRLVEQHGVRHLLLTSRRGPDAPGAADLVAALEELGASVTVAACDVSDRAALRTLLDAIPAGSPLCAVVHTAGVVRDATVEGLSEHRLDEVFEPKVDAAWHLHELTAELPLAAFVLFSSVAGLIGSGGQGNYAAANVFLDGLAAHRARAGLPAVSVAWGMWDTGLADALTSADVARLTRQGVGPLSVEQGLALFDRALGATEPLLVAATWDNPGLRAKAAKGELSGVLRGLVRVNRRPAVAASTAAATGGGSPAELVRRLSTMAESDARTMLARLVRSHVTTVLGHSGGAGVEIDRAFTELGFDSLTAVELRNRLDAETGLRLPATVAFDHPTVSALAEYLRSELAPSVSLEDMLRDTLEHIYDALPERDDATRGKLVAFLRTTISRLDSGSASRDNVEDEDVLDPVSSASDEEIFAFIDQQL